MTTDSVGADQHQGANGIQCRTANLIRGRAGFGGGTIGQGRAFQCGAVVGVGNPRCVTIAAGAVSAANDLRTTRRPARPFQVFQECTGVIVKGA